MDTREQLLTLLKKAEGTWVSGDDLAKKVAVTRAAVWKHMCRLREQGCAIESSPRKGYLLTERPDRLVAGEIRESLVTRSFGRGEVVCLERTESTNTSAKSLAVRGAPEGTIVVAETQTKGRGRKGRSWYSPRRDGLYVSIVLRPSLLLSQAGRIPILASLGLAETVIGLGLSDVSIKWPNDVLLCGRKIAGILTEVGAEMDSVDYMIIGVGINVNTPKFPFSLQGSATSLYMESGTRFFRSTILAQFLTRFEKDYSSYGKGVTGRVLTRWNDLAGVVGRRVSVETAGRNSQGVVEDLDEDGALIVRSRRGARVRVCSGDVRFQDLNDRARSEKVGG